MMYSNIGLTCRETLPLSNGFPGVFYTAKLSFQFVRYITKSPFRGVRYTAELQLHGTSYIHTSRSVDPAVYDTPSIVKPRKAATDLKGSVSRKLRPRLLYIIRKLSL